MELRRHIIGIGSSHVGSVCQTWRQVPPAEPSCCPHFLFFETRWSYTIAQTSLNCNSVLAQAGLKLTAAFLSQPLKCWDYR